MLHLRRNVIFGLVEVVSNTLLAFISYRILVQVGGVSLLGLWSTLLAWMGLGRLGDLGLGGATTHFVAALDAREETGKVCAIIETGIISNFTLILALTLASFAIVANFLDFVVGSAAVAQAAPALNWIVAAVVMGSLSGVILNSLFALHHGFVRSIISICGNLLQLALVIWLVPAGGLKGFALAQVIQFSLTAIAGWVAVCVAVGRVRLPLGFDMATLRMMLGFSLGMQAITLVNGLLEPLSKLLVSQFGGLRMQGFYEAAYRTVFTARNVSSNTVSATLPALTRYAQTDVEQARALYRKTGAYMTRALALIFLAVVLGSPVLSILWFKAVEWEFVAFMGLLAVGTFASGWCTPAYCLGPATGKLRGIGISMSTSLAFLAVVGSLVGWLGFPHLIVVVMSLALVTSSVLVVFHNEQLIGLGRRIGPFRLTNLADAESAS